MSGPADSFTTVGRGWANVSNTPFRQYKSNHHEGGIATPLIVHWPKGTRPRVRNSVVATPGHVIDVMATIVDVAKAKRPRLGDARFDRLPGVSLAPVLRGRALNRPAPLFFEHYGERAIRHGDWKLVRRKGSKDWELYDLAADRTELSDLAARQPGQVARLAARWQRWADASRVFPAPQP